jgi:antitoxin component YwqK of YwqJK toxin-antitoxin module
MNKVLLILSLVLLASCSPKEVPIDMLVEMQGLKYTFNSDTPFTGISFENDENGQLQQRVNYKDGKLDGLSEDYAENGQLALTGCYNNGKEVDMSYCE